MIKSTTEYDMFKKHPSNREMKENDIARLMQSISIKNMLNLRPIVVNSDFEIIDGQHRLEAAKQLGVKIFYIVENSSKDEDIILLNSNQKSWVNDDYLNYYVKNEYPEYVKLNNFLQKNKINLSDFIRYSKIKNKGKQASRVFREGNMPILEDEKYCELKQLFERCAQVKDFIKRRKMELNVINQSIFHRALLMFLSRSDVIYEEFLQKLEMKIEVLGPRSGEGGYYQMLLMIYNFRRRNQIGEVEGTEEQNPQMGFNL